MDAKSPELAKRFAEKVPQTVTKMMMRVNGFIHSERAFRSAKIPRGERIDNYQRSSQPNPYHKNEVNNQRPPFKGDRRRNNREEFRPRRNDHYAPYGPLRNDVANRLDYRRNDPYRRETRPIDLNALTKSPKEILATEHQLSLPPPPPLRGRPASENMDKYCDYHGEKSHLTNECHNLKEQLKRAMETGKLDHLIRGVRQRDIAPLEITTKPIKGES